MCACGWRGGDEGSGEGGEALRLVKCEAVRCRERYVDVCLLCATKSWNFDGV